MTNKIGNLLANISEEIGKITVYEDRKINPKLRRENRIKTIHSSLAIEHNTLSIEQVTAIIDGKKVLGNPNEIIEVKNAYQTYEMMLELDPMSIDDLLKAHKVMMKDLVDESGRFRSGGVGVFDGEHLVHIASLAKFVPMHIKNLFNWYKNSDMHPLIKSAIFHYEFEFIHPFSDGNGRLGRMWHSMLLGSWRNVFYFLPIEELIRTRQEGYYYALGKSDSQSNSSVFVEFMLEIIDDTLKDTLFIGGTDGGKKSEPLTVLLKIIGEKELSANEIMLKLGLKHKPTFRKNYIKPALKMGLIEMTHPDKPNSKNQKYRKKPS